METIVVGVDGSDGSADAMRWAAEEAKLRGAHLRAVIAWDRYAYTGTLESGAPAPWDQVEIDARASLDSVIERAVDDPVLRGAIERLPVEGHPTHVLAEASARAALLVVGTRGRGGLVGLLLGSTSDQIVRHARCPVVIVRSPHRPATA